MLKISLLAILLSTVAFSTKAPTTLSVIEGVVTNEEKQPLQTVHLYTILGEEEALTNDKGEFSFKTYQSFPVKLVAKRKDYEEKTIALAAAPGKLSVVLKRK